MDIRSGLGVEIAIGNTGSGPCSVATAEEFRRGGRERYGQRHGDL